VSKNSDDDLDHYCVNGKKENILLVTDRETGEIMCSTCGEVISDKISDMSLDAVFHSGEGYMSKSRTGRKSTLAFNDMGLSTLIEQSDKDSTGKSLSVDNRRTFYRLRQWDRNSKAKPGYRNMQKAFTILEGLKGKLALPNSTVEKTAYIYRKALAKKICSGRSVPIIITAALYAACRLTNTPRTIQDVSNASNLRRASVHRIYRVLVQELNLTLDSYNPVSFIGRIATRIGASEKTKRDAIKLLTEAEKQMITSGKNPMAVAATVVYVAAIKNGEMVTQTKMAKVSEVSSVTIRNIRQTLKKAKIT
jgi:transcription initiation factor TFIIB